MYLGSKATLEELIHEITTIPIAALQGEPLSQFSIEERFRWAAGRNTKRPEDKAYCLLEIFNIFLPLMYGEEENAFRRLVKEVNGLSHVLTTPVEIPTRPSCGVPFSRDTDFIDRGNVFGELEERFAQNASRVALVGIGGVGKSQLAIEYCHRLHQRSPDTWIFWVHASNIERLEQGHRQIAEQVRVPGRKDLQNDIFELVASWLRDDSNQNWLLVLDNLDNDEVLSVPWTSTSKTRSSGAADQSKRPLAAFLPQRTNGKLLVTTRTNTVATRLVEPRDVITVKPMHKREAVALLQKKVNQTATSSEWEELAKILDYMPLALVQAAAFIYQRGPQYHLRQYIEDFQKNDNWRASLLAYPAGHLRRDPDTSNSIIMTLQISFDYIREHWRPSADLLALMRFFDPQGIPKEVLTIRTVRGKRDNERMTEEDQHALEDDASEENSDSYSDRFEDDLDRSRNYSLITSEVDEQTIEMHGLEQLAVRKWLRIPDEDERWRKEFCQMLDDVFPTGDYENWEQCQRLFPHAKAAQRQPPKTDLYLRKWARILRNVGWYAMVKGNYVEAESMCQESAQCLRRSFGKADLDTLASISILASTYSHQGRWTEAEKIELEVLEIVIGCLVRRIQIHSPL